MNRLVKLLGVVATGLCVKLVVDVIDGISAPQAQPLGQSLVMSAIASTGSVDSGSVDTIIATRTVEHEFVRDFSPPHYTPARLTPFALSGWVDMAVNNAMMAAENHLDTIEIEPITWWHSDDVAAVLASIGARGEDMGFTVEYRGETLIYLKYN